MHHHLEELPYHLDALEPVFDAHWLTGQREVETACLARLTSLLDGTPWADVAVAELLRRLRELPDDQREPVRQSAGGYLNHALLLSALGPDGGGEPGYELLDDIEAAFGSFRDFQARARAAATSLTGEGWVWLVWDGEKVGLLATEHEANPHDSHRAPLLGIDLHHHAYTGSYPDKAAYVDAFWAVANWRVVAERFLEAEEATREHKPL